MPNPLRRNVTPGDALNEWINTKLKTLWVMQPGVILAYNAEVNTATVRPVYQVVLSDGEVVDEDPIAGVPVIQYGSSVGQVRITPLPDDPCLLLWSQYGLEQWEATNTESIPKPPGRVFQRKDALALCGLSPYDPTANNVQITTSGVQIQGKLSVGDIDDVEAAIKALQTTT